MIFVGVVLTIMVWTVAVFAVGRAVGRSTVFDYLDDALRNHDWVNLLAEQEARTNIQRSLRRMESRTDAKPKDRTYLYGDLVTFETGSGVYTRGRIIGPRWPDLTSVAQTGNITKGRSEISDDVLGSRDA